MKRFKQRIDLGDVIESPSGEFVLYADYEKLQQELQKVLEERALESGLLPPDPVPAMPSWE